MIGTFKTKNIHTKTGTSTSQIVPAASQEALRRPERPVA